MSTFFMVLGFLLAAYSIVANDAIQTLGTFLSSNSKRPWWVLWLFAVTVLSIVFIYGWVINDGDVSYGRLSKKFPVPEEFTWVHAAPPLVIFFLTRFGIPVSTTFLVLTVFSQGALSKMLVKSGLGYAVAFTAGIIIYYSISKVFERKMIHTNSDEVPSYWVTLQWISTAFLWSQWLIQDLANIFVYMPTRKLGPELMASTLLVLVLLHALIFYRKGGAIQKIVLTKTNTTDIRSATVIDFIYAIILLIFKQMSNIPMSTTWVFLGLLAGREIAITLRLHVRSVKDTVRIVQSDAFKALVGLAVSVALAYGLPWIDQVIRGQF